MNPTLVRAPFTPDQVVSLANWQADDNVHPFTCDNRDDEVTHPGKLGILLPTVRGWICPFCDYTQNWAYTFMASYGR